MSQDDDQLVERVAQAIGNELIDGRWIKAEYDARHEDAYAFLKDAARAAVTAMPQRLSPELIAKLNALASRLTQMGEYAAVDLIDTVVARVSAMPERELLREALSALDRAKALVDGAIANAHDLTPKITQATLERVQSINRTAADKIRAALTQEKQT
jgi:hypothetical protein